MSRATIHRLNPPALAAIEKLTAHGITLTPDDIVAIYECGKRLVRPQGIDAETLLNLPVRCGNLTLYRITVGAELWLTEMAMPIVEHDDRLTLYATAYACAHARLPDALTAATNDGIARTVSRWALGVTAPLDELAKALERLLPQASLVDAVLADADAAQRAKKASVFDRLAETKGDTVADAYGPIVAFLMREYGQTPEYWLFEQSHEQLLYYTSQLVKRMMEEAGEKAGLAAPVMRAQRAMMLVVAEIKARHKKEQANG